MSNALLVPIHLDALVLDSDTWVLGQMADFSKLPYVDLAKIEPVHYDGGRDRHVNAANPYTGEEIVSHPFSDRSLQLGPGVHLHWALPDALTQAISAPDGLMFPALPDRWLVTKALVDDPQADGPDAKQWFVESDYLHPEHGPLSAMSDTPVCFPLPRRPHQGHGQPFRYLGRSWPVGENPTDNDPEYLNGLTDPSDESPSDWDRVVASGLTAVGYGEPAFAAFYPNCRGIFGFHDPDVRSDTFGQYRYDVVGWYDDPARRDCLQGDPLEQTRTAIRTRIEREFRTSGQEPVAPDDVDVWDEAIRHRFGWAVSRTPREMSVVPDRIFCYATLTPDASLDTSLRNTSGKVTVAVGNSASEALSALLADGHPADSTVVEEQLEALDLASYLEDRTVDVGPKFQEARHAKGFRSVRGGLMYAVRLERDMRVSDPCAPEVLEGRDVHLPATGALPPYVARRLNELNVAQDAFQRKREEIESLRLQIYHDWTLYMRAMRPPEGLQAGYPDPMEIASVIERDGLRRLKVESALTGPEPILEREFEGRDTPISKASVPSPVLPDALASKIVDRIGDLVAGLEIANGVLDALARLDQAIAAAEKRPTRQASMRALLDRLGDTDHGQSSTRQLRDRIQRHAATVSESAHPTLLTELDTLLAKLPVGQDAPPRAVKMRYALRTLDAPRYHQPKDPVVLMAGDELRPTERHGTDGKDSDDGTLLCRIGAVEGLPRLDGLDDLAVKGPLHNIRKIVLAEQSDGDTIGARRWTQQPWNPFLMEWEVEMSPVSAGSNRENDRAAYAPEFVTRNYRLGESEVELRRWSSAPDVGTADSGIYSGSCILTDHAADQLLEKLDRFLEADHDVEVLAETRTRLQDIRDHLAAQPATMSQALDGFHDALLQRHRILQLPIADPIGFPDMGPFTDAVRRATIGRHTSSPLRDRDFMPIRSGRMELRRLRLIDTFGRVQQVVDHHTESQVVVSETMRSSSVPADVELPPRLVQPARVNFRWLSADSPAGSGTDEPEMNAHPAYTPVCGWILPNNLDGSLLVYDNDGAALGAVVAVGGHPAWQPAPGTDVPRWEIRDPESTRMNPHLRRVIDTIVHEIGPSDETFFDQFLSTLTTALESIAPENFTQHESLAILMGRPIAVVRAAVGLELRGTAAPNQSLSAFIPDMRRGDSNERTTDAFCDVKFPIRIGEDRQLNDGLVGYFIDPADGGGIADKCFYAPQSSTRFSIRLITDVVAIQHIVDRLESEALPDEVMDDVARPWSAVVTIEATGRRWRIDTDDHVYEVSRTGGGLELSELFDASSEHIKVHWKNPVNLLQSVADEAQKLTMLVDPQGSVHAVSGILPTTSFSIPPEHFVDVLRRLEVSFLSAPVLTDRDHIRIPLAPEGGHEWSWLTRVGDVVSETSAIDRINTQANFSRQRIIEGWFELSNVEPS